jgi:hypothetical protein
VDQTCHGPCLSARPERRLKTGGCEGTGWEEEATVIQVIEIPVSRTALSGIELTDEQLAALIQRTEAELRQAYPEARVRVYSGAGFRKISGDYVEEEEEVEDLVDRLWESYRLELTAE